MKKFARILYFTLALYAVNFLVVPFIFNNTSDITYDIRDDASMVLTVVVSIIHILVLKGKFRYFLLSDGVCFLLAMLYHTPGLYNIGMPIFSLPPYISENHCYDRSIAWFQITICIILYLLIQIIVWLSIKIIGFIIRKLKKQ